MAARALASRLVDLLPSDSDIINLDDDASVGVDDFDTCQPSETVLGAAPVNSDEGDDDDDDDNGEEEGNGEDDDVVRDDQLEESRPYVDGAELIIGSDEVDLQNVIQTVSLHNPFSEICIENLKDIYHVGDAMIRYKGKIVWIIERKRLDDLVGSLGQNDLRWVRQHGQMGAFARVNGCWMLYLIENYSEELEDATGVFNFMPVASLRAAIAHRIAADLVPVWRTNSIVETAQFLMEFAWIVNEHGFGSREPPPRGKAFDYIPINRLEIMTPENSFRIMLAQVAGIGRHRATLVADAFEGSVSKFTLVLRALPTQAARVDYLCKLRIPGVVRACMAKIVHVWFGPADMSPIADEVKALAIAPKLQPKAKPLPKPKPESESAKRKREALEAGIEPVKKAARPKKPKAKVILPPSPQHGEKASKQGKAPRKKKARVAANDTTG